MPVQDLAVEVYITKGSSFSRDPFMLSTNQLGRLLRHLIFFVMGLIRDPIYYSFKLF